MADVAAAFALGAAAVNGVAALVGAWRWWRVEESRAFWVVLRAGQVAVLLQVIGSGVLAAGGFDPAGGLYWLYALLPVAVSFVAEQLRVLAAQSVLDARGLENAEAVGRLDEAGQRSVVVAILRREMGVMTISAGVIVFLALRTLGNT